MLIENPEALRNWLTSSLKPLCDADPAALAKYVLALIKKDKPESELRETMVSQMDVFLQGETHGFIDSLFRVIESKEYEEERKITVKESSANKESVEKELEKGQDAANGELKVEADSTTVREVIAKEDRRKSDDGERKKKVSPSATGGRPRRTNRSPPRRYRERSYSPGHRDRGQRQAPARRRSRSPIPSRRPRAHSRSPPRHRPRSLDKYRSPPRRGTSRDSTPTRDEGGYNPSKRIRCRDYDEKGFCLKGDLCKFDHGTDAVVLEDSTKVPVGYTPGAPPPGIEPYIPGVPPPGFPPHHIIAVPPPGYPPIAGTKRPADDGLHGGPPSKRFDYSRIGGRGRGRGRGGRGGASSMLAIRNVPPECNNITTLNAHFARYGTLQNIQINFEGDPSSALVTFSSNDEANAAFNTPEAVMNNRFIKMFWHMDKRAVSDKSGNNQVVMVHGDRITKTLLNDENGDKSKAEKEKMIEDIKRNQDMIQTRAEMIRKNEEKRKEAVKQHEELRNSKQMLLDGLIEEQKTLIVKIEKGKGVMKPEDRKAVMSLIKEISNKIDKTKEEIKTALTISSVRTKSKQEVQKELLDAEMELFNCQQDNSDHTAEIQQKVNLLRLEAAKTGLLPTSRGGSRGRGRGRGGYRGGFAPRASWRGRGGARGRGFTLSPGSSTLDRRPSRILVSGYELDEKDELIVHFQKFGEILDIVEDTATPSVILRFKTRRFAENAMAQGKSYEDRTLQLSWYAEGSPERETEQYTEEEPHDDYTPPQHDYLPPGLQEHEDSLSQGSHADEEDGEGEGDDDIVIKTAADAQEGAGSDAEGAADQEEQDEEEEEEINEGLLDDDDEEEEEEERSWKRRNADED